jgi:hypothetical protein
MRFVELRPDPDGEVFRLHPRITWLRGLDPAARVAVIGLAHDMALGQSPDWDGVLEIDGDTMDLSEGVSRMGETAECALIVDAASLPPVVRHGTEAPVATQESLDSAREKLEKLEDRIAGLAAELAASGKVRSDMTAHLASATAQVDADAGRRLDRADGALGRAAREGSSPNRWAGMDDAADRIVELKGFIEECEASLVTLPTGDRPALAAAVAVARAAVSSGPVSSPDAAALLQVWASLDQRLTGVESRLEAAGDGTELVAVRLDAARAAAEAAELAVVPRSIRPEESEALEVLHDKVLDTEQRAGRGVRRAASRAAFDQADSALRDALAPLGFPTWAAFRMGGGQTSISQEARDEHDRCQEELEAAEAEMARLAERLEKETDLQDVLNAIERALDDARGLVDTNEVGADAVDDPERLRAALEEVTVDARSVGVDRDVAIADLRRVLGEAGAAGHEEVVSDAAMVALGSSWLGVLVAADEAAARILRDRERGADELAALNELGDGGWVDRLSEEREAVRAAESDVERCREALIEVVRARMQLHVLAATELSLAEEHDDGLVQRESARVLVELAAASLDGSTNADDAVAFADRVPRGVGGPIPVVVVMGGAPATTLERLAALPDDVQILLIGDGNGLDDWLRYAAEDVASVVEVQTLVQPG